VVVGRQICQHGAVERSQTSPDQFITSLPEEVREEIATLDTQIHKIMKGHERVLWEGRFWGGSDQRIIGYGHYANVNRSGKTVDWFIAGLAAQKNYITVFVTAVEEGAYLAERYADRLGKVKVGRTTVSFKRLADVDLKVLLELIRRARELAPAKPAG
jgi:hypothetical protein